MTNRVLMCLALAAALALSGGAVDGEAAVVFTFSGSGSSGNAEPVPLTWLVNNPGGTGGPDQPFWGIPGLGEGTLLWPSEISVTDFHITFEARTVDANDDEDVFFSTRFLSEHEGSFVDWTRVINGNSVDFFAPAGVSLDLNEHFFVNVALLGGEGIRTFEAHWTTTGVPEPASLLLVGAGLTALGIVTRRRRA